MKGCCALRVVKVELRFGIFKVYSQPVVCDTNTWSIGSRKSQTCTQACQRHYPFAMDLYNDAAAP